MGFGFVTGAVGEFGPIGGDPLATAGAALSLSLVLVPLAFVVAARMSRRVDWPIGVLIAMGVTLAAGLPLLILRDPLGVLIAGYAAGAVSSLSRPEGTTWHRRGIAAIVVAVVVLAGNRFLPLVSLVFAPALPFTVMGLVDMFSTPKPSDG